MLRKTLVTFTSHVRLAQRLRPSLLEMTSARCLSIGSSIRRRRTEHHRVANALELRSTCFVDFSRVDRQPSQLQLSYFSAGPGGFSTDEKDTKSSPATTQKETSDSNTAEVVSDGTTVGTEEKQNDLPVLSSQKDSGKGLSEGNDTRGKLVAETKMLLHLLDPDCGDAVIANEKSMTDLSEYHRVMEGWMKLNEISKEDGLLAAKSAESLLDALEGHYNHQINSFNSGETREDSGTDSAVSWKLTPDAVSYNLVLHAYAKSGGGREAAAKAQSILERMLQRCKNYLDVHSVNHATDEPPPPEPTARSFNSVMNAWAKTGEEDAGENAENVFKMMEEWAYVCQEHKKDSERKFCYEGESPNVRSFSAVIDAWAKKAGAGAFSTDRVMAIFDLMIEKRREAFAEQRRAEGSGKIDLDQSIAVVKSNVIVANSVLNAIAKSGQGMRGAERAEEVLAKIEALQESGELGPDDEHNDDDVGLKPNTRTLSLILEAWVNCVNDDDAVGHGADAVKRAEGILSKMEELYNQGYDVKPNAVTYTELITAWARCKGAQDAAERAEAILDKMVDLYKSTQDEEVKPTNSSFNSVITAHARSGRPGALQRAQAVWEKLCEFGRPDRVSYCAFIDAHAKSGVKDAGLKALDLLEEMEQDDGIEVDRIAYNSVIDALAKSTGVPEAAHRADLLLKKMEQSVVDCDVGVKPDSVSYTSTITAYARSSEPGKAEKARQVLDRMIEQKQAGNPDVKVDVFAFSTCLNAYASTGHGNDRNGKRQALLGAIKLFEEFKQSPEYGRPNQFTYGAIIKACTRLAADQRERDRLLKNVFHECRQTGYVSKAALGQFERGASRQLRKEVFSPLERCPRGGSIIPFAWYRNVRKWDRPL